MNKKINLKIVFVNSYNVYNFNVCIDILVNSIDSEHCISAIRIETNAFRLSRLIKKVVRLRVSSKI